MRERMWTLQFGSMTTIDYLKLTLFCHSQIENNLEMLLLLYHVNVSVQIENNQFRIDKSASSNQLLFLITALCNATLALNKWEGLCYIICT